MEAELTHLRTALPAAREEWHGGRLAEITALGKQAIILVCCGIGMASAAAATEAVIQRHAPGAILNYGCAGAHRADLLPGDIVIGTQVVAADRVMHEADGTERRQGMWYRRRGISLQVDALAASPQLLALAERAAAHREGTHDPWPSEAGWPASHPPRGPRAITGVICTSDRWTRAHGRITALVTLHQSACEEMEAAAIGLTCLGHDVPFLAIKDISNNELLRTTGEGFSAETAGQLGKRAAALIFGILQELAGGISTFVEQEQPTAELEAKPRSQSS